MTRNKIWITRYNKQGMHLQSYKQRDEKRKIIRHLVPPVMTLSWDASCCACLALDICHLFQSDIKRYWISRYDFFCCFFFRDISINRCQLKNENVPAPFHHFLPCVRYLSREVSPSSQRRKCRIIRWLVFRYIKKLINFIWIIVDKENKRSHSMANLWNMGECKHQQQQQ